MVNQITTLQSVSVSVFSSHFWLVKDLYERSFPKEERIPLALFWLGILRKKATCVAYYRSNHFVGFSYTLSSDELSYLFFLAVEKESQGQGIGTQILKTLTSKAQHKPLVVTIEEVDYSSSNIEQRLKRLAFYEANGFIMTPTDYHEGTETYQVLSTHPGFDPQALLKLIKTVLFSCVAVSVKQK